MSRIETRKPFSILKSSSCGSALQKWPVFKANMESSLMRACSSAQSLWTLTSPPGWPWTWASRGSSFPRLLCRASPPWWEATGENLIPTPVSLLLPLLHPVPGPPQARTPSSWKTSRFMAATLAHSPWATWMMRCLRQVVRTVLAARFRLLHLRPRGSSQCLLPGTERTAPAPLTQAAGVRRRLLFLSPLPFSPLDPFQERTCLPWGSCSSTSFLSRTPFLGAIRTASVHSGWITAAGTVRSWRTISCLPKSRVRQETKGAARCVGTTPPASTMEYAPVRAARASLRWIQSSVLKEQFVTLHPKCFPSLQTDLMF